MADRETMPAAKVEVWLIDRIIPYERNARTHPPSQIAALAKLMAKYGVDQPIVVDENGIILKGHGRLLAAQFAGFTEFPVVVRNGLSEGDKIGLRIADNQIALLAGWDEEILRVELGELKSFGFDLPMLGFENRMIDEFLFSDNAFTETVPEPPLVPTVKSGDLWILGIHRLLCGDATSQKDVAALLDGAKPHLMVTDPPYGVDYDPAWRNEEAAKGNLAYAARRIGEVKNDDRIDWSQAWKLFKGDVAYCWHAGRHSSQVQQSLEQTGLIIRSQIIWAKTNFPISRGNYHWRHEPCWYAVRDGKTAHWQGARDQTTLWQINLDKNVEGGHSTQKPLECMRRPIENNSTRGDLVYDPFIGSGTTLIAAHLTDRRCLGMDIDPIYCEVTILRWQQHTHELATCNGKTLEQLKQERLNAAGDSGESISRGKSGRKNPQSAVRKGVHARRAKKRGKPTGQPSVVAGNT